ncbi:hypothetical protein [Thermomonospora catenispora]|uniref:hypothetical protein n=1 Tax=Thermomonospora catenispora TaxID=2493090 RepID=UPI0011247BAF|nr:hypothetical protein [Thermomonospora catenispora]TNY36921.1 hypothetical protein EIO00_10160 [Thermomonospora catenispora]
MRRRVAGVLAGALLLTGGCSGGPGGPSDEASAAPAGEPAVSADRARAVLEEWTKRFNKAVDSGAEADLRAATTGPLRDFLVGRARVGGGLPRSERIALHNPVLYVPRQVDRPRWFAVAAVDDVGGAARQVLVVLEQAGPDEAWRAAHLMTFQGRPPELDFDPEGYAIPAEGGSLPTEHTEYLTTGERSTFTPDAFTRAAHQRARGSGTVFRPARHEVRALRTDDGGTLAWYAIEQQRTFAAGDRALPADVRAQLSGSRLRASRVTAVWTWLVIGYAPRQGGGHVLGESVHLSDVRPA